MAGVAGLEPVTSAVTGQRSNQLSYTPAKGAVFLKIAQNPSTLLSENLSKFVSAELCRRVLQLEVNEGLCAVRRAIR